MEGKDEKRKSEKERAKRKKGKERKAKTIPARPASFTVTLPARSSERRPSSPNPSKALLGGNTSGCEGDPDLEVDFLRPFRHRCDDVRSLLSDDRLGVSSGEYLSTDLGRSKRS